MFIGKISNQELLLKLKTLSAEERRLNVEVLQHLCEVDKRRLHLEIGYSSLHAYVVRELGYSDDAAYRRISAMRLLRSVPEVEEKLASGSLTLTAACKLQQHFAGAPTEVALELIEKCENKSTREVERELVKLNPSLERTERVRAVAEDRVEMKLVISEELLAKLDQLKALLSHHNPNMSYQEVIERAADVALAKLDPAQAKTPPRRAVQGARRVNSKQRTRHISKQIKQQVWQRDQGCCSYVDPITKRRCNSKHLLQFDHIQRFSEGGSHSAENLRLLCSAHNLARG